MKFRTITNLALTALLVSGAAAQTPDPDQLLRQMSARLATAKTFSFEAKREIDVQLLEGHDQPEKASISISVQRPNKITASSTSKAGTRYLIADGKTLSLLDEKPNHYAVVPMRTSLDGLVEQLDAKYGFTPPLAEFVLSNPYADFKKQSRTLTYLGRGKTSEGFFGLGGVECHRLWLSGKVADAELWISVDEQLPRKLIATFHRDGRPQVRVNISKWNLAAPAADFTFNPPQLAQKIELWTTAKMQAVSKN
ncbi:MAG: hypothetical protein RLZZ398_226 [Verrucomicrobiota bacterium]|jgi:hypothetical protein